MRITLSLSLLLALAACGQAEPTASPDAPPAEAAPDAPAAAAAEEAPAPEAGVANAATPGGLPDVTANLSRGQCENGPGNEGADSYFAGDFNITGSTVTGTEKWILFANAKWRAIENPKRKGTDCTVVWTLQGSTTTPVSCGKCDLSVKFHAEPQLDGDCPEELIQGRKLDNGTRVGGEGVPFDQQYDIERKPDGTAVIYFAKSGKKLGDGYHKDGKLNYVSMHQCKWF